MVTYQVPQTPGILCQFWIIFEQKPIVPVLWNSSWIVLAQKKSNVFWSLLQSWTNPMQAWNKTEFPCWIAQLPFGLILYHYIQTSRHYRNQMHPGVHHYLEAWIWPFSNRLKSASGQKRTHAMLNTTILTCDQWNPGDLDAAPIGLTFFPTALTYLYISRNIRFL